MTPAVAPSDDAILGELVEWARRDPRLELLQFRTRAAARQYRPIYAAFRHAIPRGARVLDWGAGNGHFSYFLSRAGYAATAFAFAPPALLAAATTSPGDAPVRVVAADPAEPVSLPFPAGAFDAVCSIGVLEHVAETGGDERASLAELARVLAPRGVLFCCHLPNDTSWVEWLARHAPVSGVHHHPRRFRAREIRALLAGAGLVPLRLERYGMLPRNGWGRLPRLGAARIVADLWDGLDAVLARAAPFAATNWLVIARKPAGGGGPRAESA